MASAQSHLRLLAMVVCLFAFAACDDDNNHFAPSRPIGPSFTSSLNGPPAIGGLSNGAVISGRVSGLDPTTSQIGGVTAPRVGIAPPGISTVVGRDGQFTLTGVPPGTVTLIFSSDGVSTGLILTNVGLNQLIVLDVRVSSGIATIESERRRTRDRTSEKR